MTYDMILIPGLAGVSVLAIGGAILAARAARRAPLRARLDALQGQQDSSGGGEGSLVGLVGQVGNIASSGRTSVALREHLTQAGFHDRSAASVYVGVKLTLLVLGLIIALVLFMPLKMGSPAKLMLVSVVSVLFFFAPNIFVSIRRSKRRDEVYSHLPDAVDLLEICTSAGMGLDMAWNAVADEVRGVSPILADEMALTNLEMHLGATRAEAMRHMARRTRIEELSSLVAVLVQSERFGTSIIQALHTFAGTMRENRSLRAQEAAEKMAVKILVPMVLFIFPSVVLVIIGPAVMSLYKATSGQ